MALLQGKIKVIDREARNKFAELLRHLFSGQITNTHFEANLPTSKDRAIGDIYVHGTMRLYSHFETHILKGEFAQPHSAYRHFARWILFLKTDLEYEWEHQSFVVRQLDVLIRALSFGWLGSQTYEDVAFKKPHTGDITLWPFVRQSDLDHALQSPPYLGGRKRVGPVDKVSY